MSTENKQRLDKKLGIGDNGISDINDLFNQKDIDEILNQANNKIKDIDSELKDRKIEIDKALADTTSLTLKTKEDLIVADQKVLEIDESLKEITALITTSKNIIQKVYSFINTTSFIDGDVISAAAKMIEAARITISDYIELYKEKMKLASSFQMEILKHKNRLELEDYKANLKIKVSKELNTKGADDNTGETMVYTQEAVMKMINDTKLKSALGDSEIKPAEFKE